MYQGEIDSFDHEPSGKFLIEEKQGTDNWQPPMLWPMPINGLGI